MPAVGLGLTVDRQPSASQSRAIVKDKQRTEDLLVVLILTDPGIGSEGLFYGALINSGSFFFRYPR